MATRDWCSTFCIPDDDRPGMYEIQWQFRGFTITCRSDNLSFAREILDFVANTRSNPLYRDIPLGGGVYRYMDEKSVDLSRHFQNLNVKFQKLGESDDSYLLEYDCCNQFSLVVELRDQQMIDAFLVGVKEIVDDYLDEASAT